MILVFCKKGINFGNLVKYVQHVFKTRITVIDFDITVETFDCETDTLVVVDFCTLEKLRNPNLKIYFGIINVLLKKMHFVRYIFVGNIAGSCSSSQVKSFRSAPLGVDQKSLSWEDWSC